MAFVWPKMYKWEENIERTIIDDVTEYVCEHYGIDEVEDLTQEQVNEIEKFCNEYNWEFLMAPGFRYILNLWEDAHWEASEK